MRRINQGISIGDLCRIARIIVAQFQCSRIRTRLGKEKRPPELFPAAFLESWLPTLDNLRNFLLTPTTEVLSFFQQLREAP